MKRKQYTLVWVVCIIAAILLLTACVRPVPMEPVATLTPTSVTDTSTAGQVPTQVPLNTPDSSGAIEPLPSPGPSEATAVPVATEPPPITENQVYVVKPGDSMNKIAEQFGITPEELAQANNMNINDTIHPGDELIIPGGTAVADNPTPVPTVPPVEGTGGQQNNQQGNSGVHIVQPGENLFRIGLKYGCTVNQMAQFNGIGNPNYIYPGQPIKIPPSC